MSKLMGRTVGFTFVDGLASLRRPLATLAALALLATTATIAAAQTPLEAPDAFAARLQGDTIDPASLDVLELVPIEDGAAVHEIEAGAPTGFGTGSDPKTDAGAFGDEQDVVFGANDRVWVDQGCGATYALGDAIRIYMRVDQSGYYDLRIGSSAGAKTYRLGIPAGRTVYLSGTIGQPTGTRTLRLTGTNTNVTCSFQVGATAAPPGPTPGTGPAPKPPGGLRLTKLHAADDLLRPATCLGSGSRAYFVTEVRNDGAQTTTASVAILSKGMISSWWMERIETFDLAPGESRQVLAYADEYRDADYELRAMVLQAGAEQDTRNASFKIGSCP